MSKSIILVVDDDLVSRKLITSLLMASEHANEYEVNVAASGHEALEKAAQILPDVILLDVMMPDMDGFEVCEKIRADARLSEVPIVMVTALDDRDSRIKGIQHGADDFITKPVYAPELLARVQTITRLNRYRRLHAERARFEWVISQAEEGYVLVDEKDQIIYANQRARLYLGLNDENNPTEQLGNFFEIATKQYHCEPQEAWALWHIEAEEPVRYLVKPETETTHAFWLQVSRLVQSIGSNTYRLIRLQDVTQKMSDQMNIYNFKNFIAHKLQTPLTVMSAAAELLEMDIDQMPEETAQNFSLLNQSLRNLRMEIDDVLQYIQAPLIAKRMGDQANFKLNRIPPLTQHISVELGISKLHVHLPDELLETFLLLSDQAMEWILWELLENAKKFHPQNNPTIEIRVSPQDNQLISLSVIDDGVTLTPDQLTQAWLPYYQAEKDFTGNVSGMGVGLSMVASLVWEVGGQCQILNRVPPPGVIVKLNIPTKSASAKE